ncbi:MAG: DUF4250 domain-containing protein [Lachnospiraceae bacterium]|nr:DUF4250 domain-containing protein [Lachnospiraceae bacterium]
MPTDPVILLSFINTKLRDEYGSLDELCSALSADKAEIVEKLAAVGYSYDKESNSFK